MPLRVVPLAPRLFDPPRAKFIVHGGKGFGAALGHIAKATDILTYTPKGRPGIDWNAPAVGVAIPAPEEVHCNPLHRV
jgi:hypothetical protein